MRSLQHGGLHVPADGIHGAVLHRNDELVERGRHEAAARVTAQITRVMFDMKVLLLAPMAHHVRRCMTVDVSADPAGAAAYRGEREQEEGDNAAHAQESVLYSQSRFPLLVYQSVSFLRLGFLIAAHMARTQEEMANWCTKAVLKGFQHLRELLIVYKVLAPPHTDTIDLT